ncbi:MAG: type II toxin-antitoxin system RelE/ParE family toxin [Candidatus Electrothrix sp. AW1]|nr:type II toxin-antitoxin system RelE/ParE family toxin [Candidatus Electrothrix sp. AX1]MCI5180940.1 type II toxin-antitoxin system RelE/ParE family toxin [Candidatus Electrothrix gigas]
MKINIRKSAIKDLKKISLFPNISNVKKLTNFEPAYRLRVGNYRILFDISETTIEIGRVLHRKDSYK